MDEIKQRVYDELNELVVKINKLIIFVYSDKFSGLSNKMQYTMKDQIMNMMRYADNLRGRLDIWGKTNKELEEFCKFM